MNKAYCVGGPLDGKMWDEGNPQIGLFHYVERKPLQYIPLHAQIVPPHMESCIDTHSYALLGLPLRLYESRYCWVHQSLSNAEAMQILTQRFGHMYIGGHGHSVVNGGAGGGGCGGYSLFPTGNEVVPVRSPEEVEKLRTDKARRQKLILLTRL